jgi:hypothetical protein
MAGASIQSAQQRAQVGDQRPSQREERVMGLPSRIESPSEGRAETQEQRARRLFDEMARNIGREAVNHLKTMYADIISERGRQSKSWETSLTNHVRNDINWRLRPLLMAMIAMHREWEEEHVAAE